MKELTFVHKCIMVVDKTSQKRRDTSGVIAKPSVVCADERGVGALPTGYLERFRMGPRMPTPTASTLKTQSPWAKD